jgi:hypothetical protein
LSRQFDIGISDLDHHPCPGFREFSMFINIRSHRHRLAAGLTLAMTVGLFAGCGRDSSQMETVAVSGVITFKGQPLSGATLFFVPDKGPRATAESDKDGKFRVMTYRSGDGAVPGDFKITVAKYVPDPATANTHTPGSKNEVPEKYNNPASSGLTAKIEKGKKYELKFDLTE